MKKPYRVRNWKHHNQSLVNRGNITLWFDEEVMKRWYSQASTQRQAAHPMT